MSDRAFFAADLLGMTLYQIKDHLESSEIRPIRFGPWQVDMKVDVMSDLISPRGLTFWLTLGQLQFYIIVKDKESWLVLLDPKALKACGELTPYVAIPDRLDEIEPAIKEVFYCGETNQWVKHPKQWWK